jgi:YbbR domain-containing protein
MKNLSTAFAIIIGCFILSIFLYLGLSANRYSQIEGNKIIDQKTGTIYDLDKKQYTEKNGDLYQYE